MRNALALTMCLASSYAFACGNGPGQTACGTGMPSFPVGDLEKFWSVIRSSPSPQAAYDNVSEAFSTPPINFRGEKDSRGRDVETNITVDLRQEAITDLARMPFVVVDVNMYQPALSGQGHRQVQVWLDNTGARQPAQAFVGPNAR